MAIVDAATGNLRRQLSGHKGAMQAAWSPSGLWIASGGQDGKIKLWHFHSGELFKELPGGAAWVEHVAWSPDGGGACECRWKISPALGFHRRNDFRVRLA
jgi:WD40 repeat protein